VADGSTKPPANITEFNTIAGLVFAQLYESFPVPVENFNERAIASAMGIPGDSSTHVLPSGRPFLQMVGHSLGWLIDEGYVRSTGLLARDRLSLTEKGLATLNAVPEGLSATVGSSLVKASSESGQDWSGIGDLVGGIIGGFAKTMSGS